MSTNKFPGPGLNRLIENDPQIVKVKMDYTEFGSRKSGLPGTIKNDMTIKHVGNNGK